MNPGSNLYRRASRLVRRSPIQYFPFQSRTKNAARQWVVTFGPAQSILASVQSVQRNNYVAMGLDFQKNYVTIFADVNMVDLQRDVSGDQFVADGIIYQLESQTTWYLRDGWAECLAVEIGKGNAPKTLAAAPAPAPSTGP